MNDNFNIALKQALLKECSLYDHFKNPFEGHNFSSTFETNMKKIFTMVSYNYVSVRHRRIRKSLIAILIALFILAATGCAIFTHYIISWNESQNTNQGTLDVYFENNAESQTNQTSSIPPTPNGFKTTNSYNDGSTVFIEYSNNQDEIIIFSQYNDLENMNVSIDNETENFNVISINGYKGYSYSKDNLNILYWTDNMHFFTLQGTCDMSILQTMAEKTIP